MKTVPTITIRKQNCKGCGFFPSFKHSSSNTIINTICISLMQIPKISTKYVFPDQIPNAVFQLSMLTECHHNLKTNLQFQYLTGLHALLLFCNMYI